MYWFMENPKTGRLKDRPYMKGLPYYDVDYCMYSDWGYKKRTRIWTNKKDWNALTCNKQCGNMVGNLHKTNLGKQILAIGDNAQAAKLSGIKVRQIRIIVFMISAITAIIAGILVGGYGGSSYTAGEGMEMSSVSAAVIGGVSLTESSC